MTKEDKSESKDNPKWSLIYWGGLAVILAGVGVWCILDGWFKENFEYASLNRWLTPVAFAGVIWCIYRGAKEYKAIQARGRGEGDQAAAPAEPPRDQIAGDSEPRDDA